MGVSMYFERFRVIKAHEPEETESLNLFAGEQVQFERRPSEWEGWLWVKSKDGLTGWVPEAWVEIEGKFCTLTHDYDSTELMMEEGDTLYCLLIESDWLWGETPSGATGWVPLECLEQM